MHKPKTRKIKTIKKGGNLLPRTRQQQQQPSLQDRAAAAESGAINKEQQQQKQSRSKEGQEGLPAILLLPPPPLHVSHHFHLSAGFIPKSFPITIIPTKVCTFTAALTHPPHPTPPHPSSSSFSTTFQVVSFARRPKRKKTMRFIKN